MSTPSVVDGFFNQHLYSGKKMSIHSLNSLVYSQSYFNTVDSINTTNDYLKDNDLVNMLIEICQNKHYTISPQALSKAIIKDIGPTAYGIWALFKDEAQWLGGCITRSYDWMCDIFGFCRKTMISYINHIIERGYIMKKTNHDEDGNFTENTYEITLPKRILEELLIEPDRKKTEIEFEPDYSEPLQIYEPNIDDHRANILDMISSDHIPEAQKTINSTQNIDSRDFLAIYAGHEPSIKTTKKVIHRGWCKNYTTICINKLNYDKNTKTPSAISFVNKVSQKIKQHQTSEALAYSPWNACISQKEGWPQHQKLFGAETPQVLPASLVKQMKAFFQGSDPIWADYTPEEKAELARDAIYKIPRVRKGLSVFAAFKIFKSILRKGKWVVTNKIYED